MCWRCFGKYHLKGCFFNNWYFCDTGQGKYRNCPRKSTKVEVIKLLSSFWSLSRCQRDRCAETESFPSCIMGAGRNGRMWSLFRRWGGGLFVMTVLNGDFYAVCWECDSIWYPTRSGRNSFLTLSIWYLEFILATLGWKSRSTSLKHIVKEKLVWLQL